MGRFDSTLCGEVDVCAEAIGLGAAVDYLSELGMANIAHHEEEIGGLLHQEVRNLSHSCGFCLKPCLFFLCLSTKNCFGFLALLAHFPTAVDCECCEFSRS